VFSELQQPGYLHVLINHLPIIGTVAGLFGLVVALLLKSRIALVPALAIVFLSGVSAWPVYVTGSNAYRPLMKISDDLGREWLDEHMDRADRMTWIFYAMAGVAAVAIAAPLKWPKSAIPLGIATALAAMAGVVTGGYIAQAGGLVRHVEFRVPGQTPPSDREMEPDHHH
jgi:hypothetical protein